MYSSAVTSAPTCSLVSLSPGTCRPSCRSRFLRSRWVSAIHDAATVTASLVVEQGAVVGELAVAVGDRARGSRRGRCSAVLAPSTADAAVHASGEFVVSAGPSLPVGVLGEDPLYDRRSDYVRGELAKPLSVGCLSGFGVRADVGELVAVRGRPPRYRPSIAA
jgi:hypothetical protein